MYVVPPPKRSSDPMPGYSGGSSDNVRIYQIWKGSNVSFLLLFLIFLFLGFCFFIAFVLFLFLANKIICLADFFSCSYTIIEARVMDMCVNFVDCSVYAARVL